MPDDTASLPMVRSVEPNMLTDAAAFEHGWRVAKLFATSQLIPQHLRDKPADCFIALHMARELKENPVVVMQNIYVVSGRAGWAAQYMIGRANRSGVFKGRITWTTSGVGDKLEVTASAALAESGEKVQATASMAMAKAEGWTRNTKYQSMPEHMLRWRSATMLIRLYAPEVMLGIPTADELEDTTATARMVDVTPARPTRQQFQEAEDAASAAGEAAAEPFDLTTSDGEARTFDAAADAIAAMEKELRAAAKIGRDALDGLWETNGLLLTQLRERDHGDMADELKGLYTELSADPKPEPAKAAAQEPPSPLKFKKADWGPRVDWLISRIEAIPAAEISQFMMDHPELDFIAENRKADWERIQAALDKRRAEG